MPIKQNNMKNVKILPVDSLQVYRQNLFVGDGIYIVDIGSPIFLR